MEAIATGLVCAVCGEYCLDRPRPDFAAWVAMGEQLGLDPRRRTVFERYYLDLWTLGRIAAELDKPETAVNVWRREVGDLLERLPEADQWSLVPACTPTAEALLQSRGEGVCSLRCRAAWELYVSRDLEVSAEEQIATQRRIRGEWYARGNALLDEPMDKQQLWERYHENECEATRNALAESYLGLTRYWAGRVMSRIPEGVTLDVRDLEQEAYFGLVQAIKTFDFSRGVKFESFAGKRIAGAILDYLRTIDPAGRHGRKRWTEIAEAAAAIEHEQARPAREAEIAERLGISEAEVIARVRRGSGREKSLDREHDHQHGRRVDSIGAKLADPRPGPTFRAEQIDLLRRVTRGLEREDRLVVIGYYFLGQTMKEIGQGMSMSESRVSQRHTAIIERLRAEGRLGELPIADYGLRIEASVSCSSLPPTKENVMENRIAEPSANGHAAAALTPPANPAPNFLRLLATAGPEELEAIQRRIAELQEELENLRVFEAAMKKRLDKKEHPAAASGEKLGDLMAAAIREHGPATPEALAERIGRKVGYVMATAKRGKQFAMKADKITLAK